MAYGDFKDEEKNKKCNSRRTSPDKVLRDKAFKIVRNPKYDGY